MPSFTFLGELLHQLPSPTIRGLLNDLKKNSPSFVSIFLNRLLLSEYDIQGQFEQLFDMGFDVIILGENSIIRAATRNCLRTSPSAYIRPLNFPGKPQGNGAQLFEFDGMSFWLVGLATPNDRQPSDDPVKVFAQWIEKKQDTHPVFVFLSGTDLSLKKAIVWHFSNLPFTIHWIGAGLGNSMNLTNINSERLFALDIGGIGCEDNISGWSPSDWWAKFREKIPVEYSPPNGNVIAEGISFSLDEKSKVHNLKAFRTQI
ncbi:MAG: YmdB family metallophosphoesterase [Candidatus Riflebacteria bacterium]|nr:YmdB family metallophosphoesterase [Candidatus Riflebacteria bacterium]